MSSKPQIEDDAVPPAVSVIIATYDWSAALRLALESVLAQTFRDFEVLVVGDACTDDSEAVALSFHDPRVRWFNLETNHGNQYGPNNFALERARGEFIAYLGHDDLWWPTHLEAAINLARARDAEVIAAVSILYGPPESGVRALTGLFPGNEFNPRYFFSTSGTVHRRDLIGRCGGWRSPNEALGAADFDFLYRLYKSGARFAATRELTVFQHIASWSRGAYRRRDATRQSLTWRRMQDEGERFRHQELIDVMQSVIEDRFVPTETPPERVGSAVENTRYWQAFKGSRRSGAPVAIHAAESGVRFYVEEAYVAFEWHPVEHDGDRQWRWTGPGSKSSFPLPVRIDRSHELRIHVPFTLGHAAPLEAGLWLGVQQLPSRWEKQDDGSWMWIAVLDPASFPNQSIDLVTIECPNPRRPLDLEIGEDRRWLGLCVGAIDLIPSSPS